MYFYFLQRQTNISTKVLKTITTKMCHSFFLLISPPFLCLPAFFLCCSTCLLVKSSLGPHSCRQTKTFLTLKESPEVKFTQIISRLLPNLFGLFLNTIKRQHQQRKTLHASYQQQLTSSYLGAQNPYILWLSGFQKRETDMFEVIPLCAPAIQHFSSLV